MWVLTADGELCNLERVGVVRVEERADGGEHLLVAEGERWQLILARGSEREMEALLRLIAREIDADIVGVLDVRTGRGAVA